LDKRPIRLTKSALTLPIPGFFDNDRLSADPLRRELIDYYRQAIINKKAFFIAIKSPFRGIETGT
jgi:hypothetical protein